MVTTCYIDYIKVSGIDFLKTLVQSALCEACWDMCWPAGGSLDGAVKRSLSEAQSCHREGPEMTHEHLAMPAVGALAGSRPHSLPQHLRGACFALSPGTQHGFLRAHSQGGRCVFITECGRVVTNPGPWYLGQGAPGPAYRACV